MSISPSRLVLDTNVVVRAFINPHSDSGQILRASQRRRVVPLLSSPVLDEYRAILGHPMLVERYPELDRPEIGVSLERLLYVSDFYRRIKIHFAFPRDPKDAALIELAIAGRATHLVTADKDLLSLPGGHDDAAKHFRQRLQRMEILTAEEFIRRREACLRF